MTITGLHSKTWQWPTGSGERLSPKRGDKHAPSSPQTSPRPSFIYVTDQHPPSAWLKRCLLLRIFSLSYLISSYMCPSAIHFMLTISNFRLFLPSEKLSFWFFDIWSFKHKISSLCPILKSPGSWQNIFLPNLFGCMMKSIIQNCINIIPQNSHIFH